MVKEFNEYYDGRQFSHFEGEYSNGEKNGKGKEYYDNDKIKFEGVYKYGKRNGKGKEYYKDGEVKFEGEYKNGIMYEGKMYDNKQKKIYESLGVSDCDNPDGGIGFGLLKSGLLGSHMVILREEAYHVLCCARRKTDETGIEYPFIIMGWYIENNGDFILLCKESTNDKNYYEKWFDENRLKKEITLDQKEKCDEANRYIFHIRWK